VVLPGCRPGTDDYEELLNAHVCGNEDTFRWRSPFTGVFAGAKEWWSNFVIAGNKGPSGDLRSSRRSVEFKA
jgi:hypothetical protein